MASETLLRYPAGEIHKNAPAAEASGEVIQLGDGRAAYVPALGAVAIGDPVAYKTSGIVELLKTTGIVVLDGGRVYWDVANNKAHFKKAASFFYVGTAVGDAASADTTILVDLNASQAPLYSERDGYAATVLVGSASLTPRLGSAATFTLISTNEAEKVDALSEMAVAITRKGIAEIRLAVTTALSAADVDVNFGIANGTHASDADSITELAGFHLDGGDTKIYALSRDGTTTVAATDTTKTFGVGTFQEFWIDFRDLTAVKLYVDGVRVLSASEFKLNAATGPFKLLVHIEKTASAATGIITVDTAQLRTCE
jgi:predicted RecA/RadA family phage recombinase